MQPLNQTDPVSRILLTGSDQTHEFLGSKIASHALVSLRYNIPFVQIFALVFHLVFPLI